MEKYQEMIMIKGIKEKNEEEKSRDFNTWENSIHIWLEKVDILQPPLVCKKSRWFFLNFHWILKDENQLIGGGSKEMIPF